MDPEYGRINAVPCDSSCFGGIKAQLLGDEGLLGHSCEFDDGLVS